MNRDSNMAAPPTPRLPALVKVFLTVNYQLLTLWFANKYFPSTKNIGEKMFYVFSLQVAGATACLITILYFTYLLRYIFMYASSKLLSRTHYANENSSFLIHPRLSLWLYMIQGLHPCSSSLDRAAAARTCPRHLCRPLHPRLPAPCLGLHCRQSCLWWFTSTPKNFFFNNNKISMGVKSIWVKQSTSYWG